jgi:phage-related protein
LGGIAWIQHGFNKKVQKTPGAELKKARKRQKEIET